MRHLSIYFILVFFTGFCFNSGASAMGGDTLCSPHPSPEAVALFRFLNDYKGDKILSGQMYAPWGINEIQYLKTVTGKYPAVMGVDFIHQSANAAEVQNAINWWKAGGIPTIMWHWGAPGVGEGYENSKVEINIDNCFIPGTNEYNSFHNELQIKADLLEQLKNQHIPVLWRPYHELNGNWFWWGKQGPDRFIKLWKAMFDYFVHERGLNNLIWVLCYTGDPDPAWYPGDAYVDIAGADTYNSGDGPQLTMYNEVKAIISDRSPIAYHECGIPPVPELCLTQNAMWSWWMEWHTTWLQDLDTAYLNRVYHHDLVLTRDELPDIMAEYNWDSTCKPAVLTPFMKAGDGAWQQTDKLPKGSAANVSFYAKTNEDGTLNWSGYGTTGSDTVQVVPESGPGSAKAVFVNTCGAKTTVFFKIAETCPPVNIDPYMQVNGATFQNTNRISVSYGSTVKISPKPSTGGSWQWTGAKTSNTREITFIPSSTCTVTAAYTNSCGTITRKTFYITVTCPATPITAYVKNEDGSLTVKTTATVFYGDSIVLSPQAAGSGKWAWSNGIIDTVREVRFGPVATCSPVVSFTNACGTKSTKTYGITVYCPLPAIDPYIQVNNGTMQNTDHATIQKGDSVVLSPLATNGGSWNWSGFLTASTREIKFAPDSTCILTVEYTNGCNKKNHHNFTISVGPLVNSIDTENTSLAVFPNPFNNCLILDNPYFSGSSAEITLLSANGSVAMKTMQKTNPQYIKTTGLSPGVYLFYIRSGNMIISRTLLKMN